jgi:E3 Ubiquitin ligase
LSVLDLLQNPVLWMVLSAAGMPLLFWLGLRQLKVARAITDTPTSRVRSAAQGYVEVSGVARTFEGKSTLAPLTRLPSVWWYFRIEQDEDSDGKKRWRTVKSGTSDDNFLVHDETGHCVVDPDGAEVFPAIRKVWYGSHDWPAPGLGTENRIAGAFHRYRYTEHRIPHEHTVNVMGEFRTLRSTVGDSVDEEAADLLRKWKTDQPELLRRFDANRDGVISATEWEHARKTAREYVLQELAHAPPQPALNMLSKPQDDRPFLIAGVDLDKIARRARWQAFAAWLGSVVCAGVLTWLMTNR